MHEIKKNALGFFCSLEISKKSCFGTFARYDSELLYNILKDDEYYL